MQQRGPFILGAIASSAMIGAIAYGMASGGFAEEFRAVLDLPWGRVTLVDLAAGLILIGGWIAWREGSITRALPWWVAMVLTGNLASGIYVATTAWKARSITHLLIGDRDG